MISVGKMRDRVVPLVYTLENGVYTWLAAAPIWAKAIWTGKKRIYAATASTSSECRLYLRVSPLGQSMAAFMINGVVYMTCQRLENSFSREYFEISGARVRKVECVATVYTVVLDPVLNRPLRSEESTLQFEGFFSEKYLRINEALASDLFESVYVLTVPSVVVLHSGQALSIGGEAYAVSLAHEEIDGFVSYEVVHKEDG